MLLVLARNFCGPEGERCGLGIRWAGGDGSFTCTDW